MIKSISRHALHVTEDSLYDKKINTPVFFVTEGGGVIMVQKPRRVVFDTFRISSDPENPEDPYVQIREIEDKYFFMLLDTITSLKEDLGLSTNPDYHIKGVPSTKVMADAYVCIEKNDMRVARLIMNREDYENRLRGIGDSLDIECNKAILDNGVVAYLWGAHVIVSPNLSPGVAYLCSESLGRFPVRSEVSEVDGVFSEEVGMGVLATPGLVRIIFDD